MNVLQVFSVAVAIIGLLTGAVGTLASKKKNVIIDVLSKDNIATKDYNKTLETKVATIIAERDGLQTRVDDYKELAQGSPQLKVIANEFSKFTKELKEQNKLLGQHMKETHNA